jgi:predicted transcriptional regulator
MAKTIKEQLPLIYEWLESGVSNSAIAKMVGCSERTIGSINKGETYYDPSRDYPVRKKEKQKEEPRGDAEEELWQLAYDLTRAEWNHVEKTLGAIMEMRKLPFQFNEFPFTREELEIERPACENMRQRLEFLKKRVDICLRQLSSI